MSKAPRYDVPKAAPQPLRLVQSFVNTVDLENEREWLGDPAALAAWARERDLAPAGARFTRRDLRQARELREAFRALLAANRDRKRDAAALGAAHERSRARRSCPSSSSTARRSSSPAADGIDRLCGQLVSVAVTAMLDGSWERLKACRNCRWAFFDESKNRSAHWCSMSLCGNRLKTKAYRRRQRSEV